MQAKSRIQKEIFLHVIPFRIIVPCCGTAMTLQTGFCPVLNAFTQ